MTQNIEEALAFVPPPVEDVAKAGRMGTYLARKAHAAGG
jgi:hypothetical protein